MPSGFTYTQLYILACKQQIDFIIYMHILLNLSIVDSIHAAYSICACYIYKLHPIHNGYILYFVLSLPVDKVTLSRVHTEKHEHCT
jgi:hypothetical protein